MVTKVKKSGDKGQKEWGQRTKIVVTKVKKGGDEGQKEW